MKNKQTKRLIIALILIIGVVYFYPKESHKTVKSVKEVASNFIEVKIK